MTDIADNATLPVAPRLRVFISYSRADGVFMEMMREALKARGYEVSVDKTDIVFGEDWRKRLEGMILKVEAVVFVISPDSVARWDTPPPQEAVCAWEIRRTVELGKRLIAVDFRRNEGMTLPPELKKPHHVDATRTGAEFGQVVDSYRSMRSARDAGAPASVQEAAERAYCGSAWNS